MEDDSEKTEFNLKRKEKDEVLEKEEKNEFARDPIIINCQFCAKNILTDIRHESTWIGIALCLIFFLIFKMFSLFLVILIIPLTQKTIHSCPNCLNTVGIHSFYDFISLSDKVVSLQIGKFAIIVNRKQLLGMFLFVLFFLCFYFIFHSMSFERKPDFLNIDWIDYKNVCGKEQFQENPTQAEIYCNSQYRYHNVHWSGWVVRIDYDDGLLARYRTTVLTKMEENDHKDGDLYLKFDDYYYQKYKHVFLNLTRGDVITFNATIIANSQAKRDPVMEGFSISQESGHINIHPHIHRGGRYSLGPKHVNKEQNLYGELPDLVLDKEVDISQVETTH